MTERGHLLLQREDLGARAASPRWGRLWRLLRLPRLVRGGLRPRPPGILPLNHVDRVREVQVRMRQHGAKDIAPVPAKLPLQHPQGRVLLGSHAFLRPPSCRNTKTVPSPLSGTITVRSGIYRPIRVATPVHGARTLPDFHPCGGPRPSAGRGRSAGVPRPRRRAVGGGEVLPAVTPPETQAA